MTNNDYYIIESDTESGEINIKDGPVSYEQAQNLMEKSIRQRINKTIISDPGYDDISNDIVTFLEKDDGVITGWKLETAGNTLTFIPYQNGAYFQEAKSGYAYMWKVEQITGRQSVES